VTSTVFKVDVTFVLARVVKDREDTYTKMTRPRDELRKELWKPRKKRGIPA
jgi:hypothetical protein